MYVDIGPIVDSLDDEKYDFIAKCRRYTENYVTGLGRESLAIKEIGGRTHHPAPDSYMKVLWKFRNKESYQGYQLESVLSEPLSKKVVEYYNEFLKDHQPEIEAQLKQQVAHSINITSALKKILYDELQKRGIKHIRHQAVDAFIHGCQSNFQSQLAQTTGTTVTHLVGHTVGTAVGTSIAHALSVAIAHGITNAIVHVAHSVAFKAVFKAVVVHSVGTIVSGVLVSTVATHMTAASASAAFGPVVLAAGGLYLFYKIITIPEELGEKLGKALETRLRGDFRPWTEKALEAFVEKLVDPEEMLKSLLKKEVDTVIPDLLSEMTDAPSEPPGYEDVDKDVKKLVSYPEKWTYKLWKKKR